MKLTIGNVNRMSGLVIRVLDHEVMIEHAGTEGVLVQPPITVAVAPKATHSRPEAQIPSTAA